MSDPVSGLMNLMSDCERLFSENSVLPFLHRLSVSGLFLRRILLGFEKLSFMEVSNFAAIFKNYFSPEILRKNDIEMMEESQNSSEILNFMGEISKLNESIFEDFPAKNSKPQNWTQKQSDLYVSKQVSLLQSSEMNADEPKKIEEIVQKITQQNPDLAQVHYLAYLNGLR